MDKVIRTELHIGYKLEYLNSGKVRITDRFNKSKVYNSFTEYIETNKVDSKSTLEKAISEIERQFGKKS